MLAAESITAARVSERLTARSRADLERVRLPSVGVTTSWGIGLATRPTSHDMRVSLGTGGSCRDYRVGNEQPIARSEVTQ
jgi:hypothetical protein